MPSVTKYLRDATDIPRDNFLYEGSLAALYDKIWNKQQADLVFVPHQVTRDEPAARAKAEVRECVTQLTWRVEDQLLPSILNDFFKIKGIPIRDEYRYILSSIWDIVGQKGGMQSGYLPRPGLRNVNAEGPPYNPFVGLTIKRCGEDEVPGVVVTGTYGIGKSLFLLVVLALRLLAGLTTVYQFKKDGFMVFHEEGVFHSERMTSDLLFLPQDTWFLVDSNLENVSPPQSFIKSCVSSSRKLIMAASPRKDHFKFTTKDMGFRTVWMNPFTVGEYIEARALQAPNTPPRELDLESFFQLYGPSARTAFLNVPETDTYQDLLKSNIDGISWAAIDTTIREVNGGYFQSEFSHLVLVAKRLHDKPLKFYVEFASRHITEMMLETFVRREEEDGYRLYRKFCKANNARACAGNLLEVLFLSRAPLGGQWEMRRMKVNKKHMMNQQNQHWVVDESSPVLTVLIGHEGRAVKIEEGEPSTHQGEFSEVDCHEYKGSIDPSASDIDGFYISIADNQASFDAWFYDPTANHTVVIQSTVSMTSHDIKSKGLNWLNKHTVDFIIVSDEKGGTDINMPYDNAGMISNVYRLVY